MFAIALSSETSYLKEAELGPPQTIWWIDRGESSYSTSIAKIAGRCESLDFGEIQKDLAVRLTDAHISDILLCLDREDNRIKKFRLTNCTRVNGSGMWSLKKSTTIEYIDLSIVPDHKNPRVWCFNNMKQLSFRHVVKLLDSIVSLDDLFNVRSVRKNSLKYLHLPWDWRSFLANSQIKAFMERYKRMWASRSLFC
ncbi:hypothetical protein QTG54_010170 [Skeletonema marinoi]|uniref:Uncharacterized protein n=1 Tax=Skeletonema marinoi TaxID=267567 RepID=A0AAD9DAF0_9STRA|nr:hypothetical protein QTG54_010170 [Skeletonema marinoi]